VGEQLTPERLGLLGESVTNGHGSDRADGDGAKPVVGHDAQLSTLSRGAAAARIRARRLLILPEPATAAGRGGCSVPAISSAGEG
jgi:hypothetical protein